MNQKYYETNSMNSESLKKNYYKDFAIFYSISIKNIKEKISKKIIIT